MIGRADNLGALPFTDYADPDPDRLPLNGNAEPCGACNAEEGEDCRPWCLGRAAADDADGAAL